MVQRYSGIQAAVQRWYSGIAVQRYYTTHQRQYHSHSGSIIAVSQRYHSGIAVQWYSGIALQRYSSPVAQYHSYHHYQVVGSTITYYYYSYQLLLLLLVLLLLLFFFFKSQITMITSYTIIYILQFLFIFNIYQTDLYRLLYEFIFIIEIIIINTI